MKTCPNPECPDVVDSGVVGEYVDRIERCPKCGAPLEAVADEPATDKAEAVGEFVLAARVSNAALIPLVKSLLADAGIVFYTRNETVQDLIGWGRLGTGYNVVIGEVEFWVPEEDRADAVQILADLDESVPRPHAGFDEPEQDA